MARRALSDVSCPQCWSRKQWVRYRRFDKKRQVWVRHYGCRECKKRWRSKQPPEVFDGYDPPAA